MAQGEAVRLKFVENIAAVVLSLQPASSPGSRDDLTHREVAFASDWVFHRSAR